jgi:HopA1 effector protein family
VSPYHEQVAAALAALEVRSPTAYSWLGQVFERRASSDDPAVDGAQGAWLEHQLHARLYADFYLVGGPVPASEPRAWRIDLGRVAAADQLSAANRGRGSRQAGWRVRRREPGAAVLWSEGLEVWARSADIEDSLEPVVGSEVTIRLPKERVAPGDAFYTVLGDAGQGAAPDGLDRFYWHIRPPDAARLVAAGTETLNRAALPFRLKVVNDPRAVRRSDAGVVYTRRMDRAVVLPLVHAMRERLAGAMRPSVPALCLRLAPGLAFAEDPGGGESYGSHRCRLIAHAAIDAWNEGSTALARRLELVDARFRAAGLDLGRPYLSAGSPDDPALRSTSA